MRCLTGCLLSMIQLKLASTYIIYQVPACFYLLDTNVVQTCNLSLSIERQTARLKPSTYFRVLHQLFMYKVLIFFLHLLEAHYCRFVLQVASVTFDLLLLLVLGSCLIVLFSFLVITTWVLLFLHIKLEVLNFSFIFYLMFYNFIANRLEQKLQKFQLTSPV